MPASTTPPSEDGPALESVLGVSRGRATGEVGGVRLDVVAHEQALPFADGTFDRARLEAPLEGLGGRSGEWTVRELVRVVRPGGGVAVALGEAASAEAPRRTGECLRAAGVHVREDDRGDGGSVVLEGRRESGVSAETWSTFGSGRGATAWNDEMFEYQRTPYDPWTIAGRIFLRRVRWVAKRVREQGARRVLEVGCEAGGLLRHLPRDRRIVGLDLSVSALRTARRELADPAITLVHADATRPLPFRDGEFDAVIASEVLEHCRSPRRIVSEIHRVLAADGRAMFTVPNERRYLAWKEWLARFPLTRFALRGIEEGPAAWHVDHDFDRAKLLWLVDGFFTVERESSILGTTLAFVLRKAAAERGSDDRLKRSSA